MQTEKILKIAEEEMKYRTSHPFKERGNKFYHGQRVGNIVRSLCDALGYDKNVEALVVAGWFHDARNGIEHHEKLGSDLARERLTGLCSECELELICRIISVHDQRDMENLDMATMIVQDADLLDHFGLFRAWFSFQNAVRDHLSMADVAENMLRECERDTVDNRSIHFDISREIYEEKVAYIRSFAERLAIEGNGGVVFSIK